MIDTLSMTNPLYSYPHKLSDTGMIYGKYCIYRRRSDVLFDICPVDREKEITPKYVTLMNEN